MEANNQNGRARLGVEIRKPSCATVENAEKAMVLIHRATTLRNQICADILTHKTATQVELGNALGVRRMTIQAWAKKGGWKRDG